jgi:hypothetical protein
MQVVDIKGLVLVDDIFSFAPFGASLGMGFAPTTCVVGCILPTLRGWIPWSGICVLFFASRQGCALAFFRNLGLDLGSMALA